MTMASQQEMEDYSPSDEDSNDPTSSTDSSEYDTSTKDQKKDAVKDEESSE